MQEDTRDVLKNTFAWLSFVFWSFQLLPQVWHNRRRQSTQGLSKTMMWFWYLGCILYAPYAIADGLMVSFVIQPEIFAVIALMCVAQGWYYDRGMGVWRTVGVSGAVLAASGGIQVGIVFGLRAGMGRGVEWPLTMMGILPDVFIAVGFLPQFYDVIWRGGTRGVSIPFLCLDTLGSIFSIIAVAFFPEFDWVAAALYMVVLFMDLALILVCVVMRMREGAVAGVAEKVCIDDDGDEDEGISIITVVSTPIASHK